MGKAISLLRRQQVIAMRTEGHGYESISCELGLTRGSVRTICQRYKKEGQAGLQTRYANAGKAALDRSNPVYRAALWLKRLHPLWGTPRIRCKLTQRYGQQVPTVRTLNRWYKAQGLHPTH